MGGEEPARGVVEEGDPVALLLDEKRHRDMIHHRFEIAQALFLPGAALAEAVQDIVDGLAQRVEAAAVLADHHRLCRILVAQRIEDLHQCPIGPADEGEDLGKEGQRDRSRDEGEPGPAGGKAEPGRGGEPGKDQGESPEERHRIASRDHAFPSVDRARRASVRGPRRRG